jgi:glucan phosphorylase
MEMIIIFCLQILENVKFFVCILMILDCEAQAKVDETWREPSAWIKKSIMSTAGSGKFSSDRSIKEYAEKIWKLEVQSLVQKH